MTLIQAGYGVGVLLLVPLGDIMEVKKLVLSMIVVTIFGVIGLAFAGDIYSYLLAALVTGLGASAAQVVVPYTSHLVEPQRRGQVVGTLMSGLMIGIMLSRPLSSYLTDLFSWHTIFIVSAVIMVLVMIALATVMPKKYPDKKDLKYRNLLTSMYHIYKTEKILRRRSIYQASMFSAFCIFWTASPLYLMGSDMGFTQTEIAIFALAGVAGAIVAPLSGKVADRGHISMGTVVAMSSASLAFLLGHLHFADRNIVFGLLVFCAILLDAGVTANLVLGQRVIFSLPAEIRSRVNGLHVATIFIGGAIGSALGAWSFVKGGWPLTSMVGFSLPVIGLLYFLTESKILKEEIKHKLAHN
ncbi:transporter, major facilitator family protein [Bacteriovorax sp. Seq25_V]|nr:transporter, major facilitator family protein [Bacteriovorax sp. Seq25_V]